MNEFNRKLFSLNLRDIYHWNGFLDLDLDVLGINRAWLHKNIKDWDFMQGMEVRAAWVLLPLGLQSAAGLFSSLIILQNL